MLSATPSRTGRTSASGKPVRDFKANPNVRECLYSLLIELAWEDRSAARVSDQCTPARDNVAIKDESSLRPLRTLRFKLKCRDSRE